MLYYYATSNGNCIWQVDDGIFSCAVWSAFFPLLMKEKSWHNNNNNNKKSREYVAMWWEKHFGSVSSNKENWLDDSAPPKAKSEYENVSKNQPSLTGNCLLLGHPFPYFSPFCFLQKRVRHESWSWKSVTNIRELPNLTLVVFLNLSCVIVP